MSRLRESALTLAAIALVAAVVCAFSVATSAYIDQQATAGLRSELSAQAGEDLALRASLDSVEDADQQDAEVRRAIAKTLGAVEVTFDTTRTLEAGAIFSTGDQSGPAETLTVPDLETRAVFDTGAAPTVADQVAVQANAAAALGLRAGDQVSLNQVVFTVSGTWRPIDPLDPRWYGDEAVETGGSDRRGPFVITEDAWDRFDLQPKAVWTVVPTSIDDFTSSNSSSVGSAWATVQRAWRGEVSGFDSLQIQSQLARTLDDFDQRVEGLRAIEPVAAALIAGSALVALWQLVQVLVASRERDALLFWARGRSTAAIASLVAGEVASATVFGAAVGVSAVVIALSVAPIAGQSLVLRPSAFVVPTLVVIAAILIAAASSYRSTTSVTQSTRGGRGDSRARRVAAPGAVLLVALGAALSVWQLRRYGSPLTTNADGSTGIDPLVVVAPALALIAVVLAALAAFPAVVGLDSRRIRGSGVVGIHLAARTLARQTARVAAPLVIVALAVGSGTMAATFSATWSHLYAQNAALHVGADVRVSSPLASLSAAQRDAVAATDNVVDVIPVDVQTLSLGTVTASVVAATPDALRQVAHDAGGVFAPDEAADDIQMDDPGPIIPDGADTLTLRVEALGFDAPPALSAWIADRLGSVRSVTFASPTVEADGVLAYTVAAGEHAAPGSLISIDISFADQSFDVIRPSFRLVSLDADVGGAAETVPLGQYWSLDTLSDFALPPESNAGGDGFVLDAGLPFLRMTSASDGAASEYLRPRVVISAPLARALDLRIGDLIALSLRDVLGDANAVVTAIVPAIPGADSDMALLMDLSAINHFHQRTSNLPAESSDLWMTTVDQQQQQVRDSVRGVVPANAQIELRDNPESRKVLGAASIALWASAAACLLFAFIAMGSASSSRIRWGRNDIAALRALGMRPAEQSAVVMREMLFVLAASLVAGAAAGALVGALTVPQLARAAVDRGYLSSSASLAVDWTGLGLLLGALVVGIAAILVDLSRRVRSLASRLLPGEGHE